MPASAPSLCKPISRPRLLEIHARGEKITMLTAHNATFTGVAGLECILVGDLLGLETMRYHLESVARGLCQAQATVWLIGDLPFGTYHE